MLHKSGRAGWYRVVTISEAFDPSGVASGTREATLAGRDWDLAGGFNTDVKAAVVRNVVGVTERTIRLKTDSLWQP